MSTFFTWANLATIAGATAATAYIVQFLKKFSCFSKANSQAVSYAVALIILFLATFFTGGLTASTGVMIFFNAIIVAFSSNGAYDSVKSTIATIVSAKESSKALESESNKSASDTANKSFTDKVTADTAKVAETLPKASELVSKTVIG